MSLSMKLYTSSCIYWPFVPLPLRIPFISCAHFFTGMLILCFPSFYGEPHNKHTSASMKGHLVTKNSVFLARVIFDYFIKIAKPSVRDNNISSQEYLSSFSWLKTLNVVIFPIFTLFENDQ
jgi:hypothetical protein